MAQESLDIANDFNPTGSLGDDLSIDLHQTSNECYNAEPYEQLLNDEGGKYQSAVNEELVVKIETVDEANEDPFSAVTVDGDLLIKVEKDQGDNESPANILVGPISSAETSSPLSFSMERYSPNSSLPDHFSRDRLSGCCLPDDQDTLLDNSSVMIECNDNEVSGKLIPQESRQPVLHFSAVNLSQNNSNQGECDDEVDIMGVSDDEVDIIGVSNDEEELVDVESLDAYDNNTEKVVPIPASFPVIVVFTKCNVPSEVKCREPGMHNFLERKRRAALANCFVNLRQSVPVIRDDKRCTKLRILKEAKKYIELLKQRGEALLIKKEEMLAERQKKSDNIRLLMKNKGS